MRRYETIAIIDPDLSDDDRNQVLQRITNLIPKEDGFLIMLDEWGNRKLAYEIKKKVRGYYVRIDYCGMGPLVDEMERFFRIDDKVLKFMTVLLEKDADAESIKEEMARAKSEAEAKAKSDAEAEATRKAEEAKKEADAKAEEAKKEADAKADEAKKEADAKVEEAKKEADETDMLQQKDDEPDTADIPLDSPESEIKETEKTGTETSETEIIKEEQ
ncbi:MAG: 30S ribosomal protein S6 [Desulfobacterales bacterium]|nr:30S ribosomal protein S6 [Deltaproteobacteria bacterium]NNL43783.1 30S ribosomal protein S6 [Desulfobacterales bacterium]